MMTKQQSSVSELKLHVHGLANSQQADQCTKRMKAIAEHVGQVHSPEMKVLVCLGHELEPEEPDCPSDAADEKAKAIWSKKCDLHTKKSDKYVEHKAKTFTVVFGCCGKPMKNQVESHADCEDVMANHDMVTLLCIIKDAACDANDRKHPSTQAARAWKSLAMCRQGEKESLPDCCTRFTSLVEMVERLHGPAALEEIAKKDK